MATRKRKKYGNGTAVTDYIQNPYEKLQEDKLDKAEAVYEGTTNPWVVGLQAAGNLMMQQGMQKGGTGNQMLDSLLMMGANAQFPNGGVVGTPPPIPSPTSTYPTFDINDPNTWLGDMESYKTFGYAKSPTDKINIPKGATSDYTNMGEFIAAREAYLRDPSQFSTSLGPTAYYSPEQVKAQFKKIGLKNEQGLGSIYVPNDDTFANYDEKTPITQKDWEATDYYLKNAIQPQSLYMKRGVGNRLGQFPFHAEPILDTDPSTTEYEDQWLNRWLIENKPKAAYGKRLNYATGGTVPVEVEGEEVIETPNGELLKAKGPTHEGGGVDVNLPGGSKVYSNRIKVQGETMQERKTTREKRRNTLESLLNKNQSDVILKGTLNRIESNNKKQEEIDMNIQQLVDTIMGGTPVESSFQTGGIVGEDELLPPGQITSLDSRYSVFSPGGDFYYSAEPQGNVGSLPTKPLEPIVNPDLQGQSIVTGPQKQSQNEGFANSLDQLLKNINSGNAQITGGDVTSLTGDLISSFGPYLNTLKNRATDTPNINPYENFGVDAMAKLEQVKNYLEGIKDTNLSDLELSRNAAITRGRNTARGVNTMRALDLATDQGINREKANIQNQFAQSLMQLMGQEAQAEFTQDQVVMQGEEKRDLYDRMDNDNFSTQMAQDIVSMGQGLQETGKDLNTVKQREYINNLLSELSKYGVTVDTKGNITQG